MKKDEALKLALEALELHLTHYEHGCVYLDPAVTAIKEALAQPEQKPVAWMDADGNVSDNNDHNCFPIPLYTTPPQRTWVGLTDEEVDECYYWKDCQWTTDELVRHVEAKLKEKNT